jgi:hypothetical protein
MNLAHQPLFQLLGSLIVLLITDYRPALGIMAFAVWFTWIYMSIKPTKKSSYHVSNAKKSGGAEPLYGSSP